MTAKRVTITFDVEAENLTDEGAVDSLIDAIMDGDILTYKVQDLPDLSAGKWVDR